MYGLRVTLLALCVQGCGSAVTLEEGEAGTLPLVEEPIWSTENAESTAEGLRVPVCVPVEAGCLRLGVLINTQERLDQSVVTGTLVGPDCAPTAEGVDVDTFHGHAYTGHGTLWLDGDARLSDGSALVLDVEAQHGPCSL